jgi:hypothetical protein
VVGCCERGNKPSGSIKGREFLDWVKKKEEFGTLLKYNILFGDVNVYWDQAYIRQNL